MTTDQLIGEYIDGEMRKAVDRLDARERSNPGYHKVGDNDEMACMCSRHPETHWVEAGCNSIHTAVCP